MRFYHYGFHLIVPEIQVLTGFAVTDIMLSLGTFLVILAPFTLLLPFERLGFDKKSQRWAVFWHRSRDAVSELCKTGVSIPALLSVVLLPLPLILDFGHGEDDKKEKVIF